MMKNYLNYIVAFLAVGFTACEPEFENPVDEPEAYSSGEADLSTYVALGNSLTAGYADNALYVTGQKNSYPNILAQQFAKTQETNEFTIPYMNDNAGGLLVGGEQITQNRLVLSVVDGDTLPRPYTGAEPTTDVLSGEEGPYNNMGIPGAKSYHLVTPGYGSVDGLMSSVSNPYFVRFATSQSASVIEDAMMLEPTFFSLWIGNNDVLGYATSGGVGEDQTNNTDPSSYGQNDITDPNVFASVYNQMVESLSTTAAGGVLINIPDVTSVPFFTTVPNNALALDAETAGKLTSFFQALSQVFAAGLMQEGVPQAQAQALAAQYALEFNQGANRFIIETEPSETNPLGFRQMTPEEMLLLTIDQTDLAQGYGSVRMTPEVMQVLGMLQQGEHPNEAQVQILFNAVTGIEDQDALDLQEIQNIQNATVAYNQSIASIAEANGLALLDANALLGGLTEGGYPFDGGVVTSDFVTGGAFSLDGIHLTPRGYAIVANEMIEEINKTYGASIPSVNIGNYATVTFNNNVQ